MITGNNINIFFCATPYHIFIAHLIREQIDIKSSNVLIMLTDRHLMSDTIIDKSLWQNVLRFNIKDFHKFKPKSSILEARRKILSIPSILEVDNISVFIGNNTDWRLQIILRSLNYSSLHLFDEGLASYVSNTKTLRSKIKSLLRFAFYKLLYGRLYYNCNGVGKGKADSYYALHKLCFPHVQNRQSLNILTFNSSNYEIYLRNKYHNDLKYYSVTNSLLLISEPLSDFGIIPLSSEIIAFNYICLYIRDNIKYNTLFFKKHPAESDISFNSKISIINSYFANESIEIVNNEIPIAELFIVCKYPPKTVIGGMSSVLFNIKILDSNVSVLSFIKLIDNYPKHKLNSIVYIFDKVGIEFI